MKKRKLALRRYSHSLCGGRDWWYEERGGISVIAHTSEGIGALIVFIPWGRLIKAARRAGKLPGPR